MAAPPGSILPSSYFDGLSSLWGGCAYVASAIVTTGVVVQAVRLRPDPGSYLWLFAKILLIGITTLFLREWLMRLNDIVFAFGAMLGVDPTKVDEKFLKFLAGKAAANPKSSVWDIIWGTSSVGTAITYAFLWLFGWMSWGIQYIAKLIGGVLLTAGWALSPIFLSFFLIRPMSGIATKYLLGLIALVCWPFGWVIASVVTDAMLEAAASAKLMPIFIAGEAVAGPGLTILLIGGWMIVSSALAPFITTKILLMGANPAGAFARGVGDVGHATFAGGVGAATAAATGGATAAGVVAAAAVGAISGGTESAARGGGSPRVTGSSIDALSGFYRGSYMRQQTATAAGIAAAEKQHAEAAHEVAAAFSERVRRRKSRFPDQPHVDDPKQAIIDIDSNAKS